MEQQQHTSEYSVEKIPRNQKATDSYKIIQNNTIDSNHDGISDEAYVIDKNNIDKYPLMIAYDTLENNQTFFDKIFWAIMWICLAVLIALIGLTTIFFIKKIRKRQTGP